MEPNFNVFKTINFSLFSESEITRFHYATLDILKNIGGCIFNKEAIDLLKKAGCKVNGNIVRVPPHIVERAIFTAPKQITMFKSTGEKSMELEGEKFYFGTGSTTPYTLDVYTGERRITEVKDVELLVKVADSLRNIDFVMPPGSVSDVPKEVSDIYEFVATIKYTNKPFPFIRNL